MTRIKLLILEKNLHDTTQLKELIDEAGYELIANVNSSAEAQKIISITPPDVVLICTYTGAIDGSNQIVQLCEVNNIPFLYVFSEKEKGNLKNNIPALLLAKPLGMSTLRNLTFSSIQQLSKGYNANKEEGPKDFVLKDNYFIKKNNRLIKVPIKDFLFIQSDGNYCAIQTANGKFMVRKTLSLMEKILPMKHFIRAHKSFIVRLDAVEQVAQTNAEILIHGQIIPIGRKFRDRFYNRLQVLS